MGLNSPGFYIFGHSAGAQFVHRYLAFRNSSLGSGDNAGAGPGACAAAGAERRLQGACAANAGAYLLPSFEETFPFGLRGETPGVDIMAVSECSSDSSELTS